MKIHTTNYYDTFIEVPEDCPITTAELPPVRKNATVARKQYELLVGNPYHFTSDDVLYATTAEHKGISRELFFSKGQACFRASPLVKRYGWGIHCDEKGKIALYALESSEYQQFVEDDSLTHIRSLRWKK
ncbi:DUF6157 family protein [Enterococcus olivae]